jgi:hypothetical protein
MVDRIFGGCLCGGIRYRYDGPLGHDVGTVTACFCSQCRKAQGFAAATAPALAAGFSITQGQALLREYESSPGKKRGFCGVCGSPLYSRRDALPQAIRLRLGALEGERAHSIRMEAHIYTEGAPAWSEAGAVPRYPGEEPQR